MRYLDEPRREISYNNMAGISGRSLFFQPFGETKAINPRAFVVQGLQMPGKRL